MTVDINPSVLSCLGPGMSHSLESVLSGHRPRSQTVTTVGVDQQGRLVPPVLAAHSVVMQKDPRRFSEASIGPPPRPPPPNLKRQNIKSQRRPVVLPIPGTPWPPHMVMAPQPQPQQSTGGSNLGKMTHMARSTPQLDDNTEGRERERSREKPHHLQNTRDNLISQVTLQLFVFSKNSTSVCCQTDNKGRFFVGHGGGARRDHRRG